MIYFTLDDFCDEHAEQMRPLLNRILDVYPRFKATLFTIPQTTSKDVLERWTAQYPCLQFAVHGLDHHEGETWFGGYHDTAKIIMENFGLAENGRPSKLPLYVAGFKAPWWKLGTAAAEAFNDCGYWVGLNGIHTDQSRLKKFYDYKTGRKETFPDMVYFTQMRQVNPQCDWFWHGHVQSQRKYNGVNPNGLPDILTTFLDFFEDSPRCEFGFVNDLFAVKAKA